MTTRRTRSLPPRVEDLQRRFKYWRQSHQARSRIPNALWTAAVRMADRYGLNRTAKALRLDYYSLKRRLEARTAVALADRSQPAVATFLELAPAVGPGECTLELEDSGGAKMRVHLKSFAAPDLAALSRTFWTPGASSGERS